MQRCAVAKAKQVKLFLHHRYDHVESGPAEVAGKDGKQVHARLLFIPFEYATPTYGDVVVAARDPEFERNWAFEVPSPGGMPESQLHEWGGRYAMVVRYKAGGKSTGPWFPGREDIMSSMGIRASDDGNKPGLVYFAVPKAVRPPEVMAALAASHPAFAFEQLHPKPRKVASRRRRD
jgi:hypothetical protein